jgi:hypothetical protein
LETLDRRRCERARKRDKRWPTLRCVRKHREGSSDALVARETLSSTARRPSSGMLNSYTTTLPDAPP